MSKCKVCRTEFQKRSMTHKVCSPECSAIWVQKEKAAKLAKLEAAERKRIRERLVELKPRSYWQARAQAAVNKFARVRDRYLPCISCGRFHQGQWHGGHFLSRGARPELALDPRNVHKQCQPCNTEKSGNQLMYRQGLIQRYGVEYVEWLEGPHPPKKYTIEELKQIEVEFKRKVKEIEDEEKRTGWDASGVVSSAAGHARLPEAVGSQDRLPY